MEVDSDSIESVAVAVVREYLHGKGYHNTLSSIDIEAVGVKAAVNSRSQLAKLLAMEKLLKKNKQDSKPLKTMLEILIKHVVSHKKRKSANPLIKTTSVTEVNCLPLNSSAEKELLRKTPDIEKRESDLSVSNRPAVSETINKQSSDKHQEVGGHESEVQMHSTRFDEFSDQFKSAFEMTQFATLNEGDKTQACGNEHDDNKQLASNVGYSFTSFDPHNSATDWFPENKSRILDLGSEELPVTAERQLTSKHSSETSIVTTLKVKPESMKSNPHRVLPGCIRSGGLPLARNRSTSGRKGSFFPGSTHYHHLVTSAAIISEGGSETAIYESNHSAVMDKNEVNRVSGAVPSLWDAFDPSNNDSHGMNDMTGVVLAKNGKMGNWLGAKPPASHLMKKDKAVKTLMNDTCADIEVGDLDELDERNSGLMVSPDSSHIWLTIPHGVPIDCDTAVELKTLLLGSYKAGFPEEWKIQDFALNKNPKLYYGIVQKKGGPCGVLACVQAYLLKELIFTKSRTNPQKGDHSLEECRKCLALSLAHILWKCCGQRRAVVVMPSNCKTISDGLPGLKDGFIEKINIMQFSDLAALQSFLNRHISWYSSENRYVCIAFLYSAILSRGINEVKSDMDDPNTFLIAKNGYCSQEVVNLLLTGSATSNVFDNFVKLDDNNESHSILKGITRRSEIGFLALYEHYNSCQVGTFLKSPRYPVWVVCSESHFSVLFAKDLGVCEVAFQESNELAKFELFYYDGLLQQENEIKLTMQCSTTSVPNSRDLTPPLEHCIRTKWKGASVDWNGTEPLL